MASNSRPIPAHSDDFGMTRRALMASGGVVLAASAVGIPASAAAAAEPSGISWPAGQALPRFGPPKRLDVTDLTVLTGDEKLLLGTLQGVVNRVRPRIYLIGDDAVAGEGRLTWLRDLDVPYTIHDDAWALIAKYRDAINGSIVFDPAVPDSINVATTLAGIEDAVVANPELAQRLSRDHGIEVIDDLRDRFESRIDAYRWSYENLWSKTTDRMLIGLPPQREKSVPPGIPAIYETLARVDAHEHDAANRDTYEFDISAHLGGPSVWVRFDDAFTGEGWGPAVSEVVLRADGQVIDQFVPGTPAEEPYLFDPGNSQVSDGPPQHRFADGSRYFVYQFQPPASTQSLTLAVTMWNEYTVSVTPIEPTRATLEGFAYLRDYAVANRALTFWLDPNITAERQLFVEIMLRVEPYTPYLGWFSQDVAGEFGGTELASRHGVYVLAADWFENMSVHSGARAAISAKREPLPPPSLQNKVYVTFVMSEGDNLQYNEHRLRVLWDDRGRGSVPINWTTSPLLKDAARNLLGYFQRTATDNDLLVAGPSGAGYIYPGPWSDDTFGAFAEQTRGYMNATGMDTVYLLNRVDGRDVPLSDAEAAAYVDVVSPRGMWLHWTNSTETTLVKGGTPISTVRGVSTVEDAQRVIAESSADWDGSEPLFLTIGILAWGMTPTDLKTVADSLDTDHVVVRGDQFFDLVRESTS